MSPEYFSTLHQRFACARLPDPYLTHQVRLFPHRSRPRSSAKAPVGGLKPPPARRLRRATKPSSPAQHRVKELCLHAARLHVLDTHQPISPGRMTWTRLSARTDRSQEPRYASLSRRTSAWRLRRPSLTFAARRFPGCCRRPVRAGCTRRELRKSRQNGSAYRDPRHPPAAADRAVPAPVDHGDRRGGAAPRGRRPGGHGRAVGLPRRNSATAECDSILGTPHGRTYLQGRWRYPN